MQAIAALLALAAALLACAPPGPARPPNVLLVTIESLRADHVGFQGGRLPTTPELDALARESIVYENGHSVTSWTLASHASLFTGLYPSAHQTLEPLDRLADGYETLAEVLAKRGYQTAGVVSGPYLRRAHRLDQGFERWDDALAAPSHVDAHGEVTNPGMLASLERFLGEERDPARPFFLFAYFWDPHYDYLPPPPYDELFVRPGDERADLSGYGRFPTVNAESPPGVLSYVLSQYDGEIRWTDAALGLLFRALREADLWDETLVVVTADHGEEFFEHGWKGHKNNLYVESVHVPLVVKLPGSPAPARDARLASLVDVFPTVLEATGTPAQLELHGRSLLEPAPPRDRAIFFELKSAWYAKARDRNEVRAQEAEWHGIRRGSLKLVGIPGRRMYLFDVGADPGERTDLLGRDAKAADAARGLEARLAEHRRVMQCTRARFARDAEAPRTAELAAPDLDRLRALGYVK